MIQSKITSKNQTTIPKEVREALGVTAGDTVRYAIVDGRVHMYAKTRSIKDLAGILPKPERSLAIEDLDDIIADAVVSELHFK